MADATIHQATNSGRGFEYRSTFLPDDTDNARCRVCDRPIAWTRDTQDAYAAGLCWTGYRAVMDVEGLSCAGRGRA